MSGQDPPADVDADIETEADRVFDFDGRPIPFRAGHTVGAALIAAGIRSWRTTRLQGRPRGLFCGIGVCHDCLVVVDGVPNQRACRVAAMPGLAISTQSGTGWESQLTGDQEPA